MIDLVVKGGKVVLPEATVETNIAIDDGKIVALGSVEHLPKAEKVVEAKGNFILPGRIDPHTHFNTQFMGAVAKDDFDSGTVAGAFGGVTTVINFVVPRKKQSPLEAIREVKKNARGRTAVDYSLHSVLIDASDKTLSQIKEIIESGIPSFKIFMIYRKEGRMIDDGQLLAILREIRKHGGLVGAHAENAAMIEYNIERALEKGNTSAIYHALTKPNIVEAEAINRAIFLTNYVGVAYYNFHISIKKGVSIVREARSRGQPVYAETCTHYLVLTNEKLEGPDGINYICSPPLRGLEDVEALWGGISDGTISTIGSDHVAFSAEQKKKVGKKSFADVPNGMPGIEFCLPILFSEGISKGRISINKLAAVTSTNAAKILGLYPRKGVIMIGSDADLVLVDPKIERTISREMTKINLDWCPYEGLRVKGWPIMTISKGKIIVEDNIFVGNANAGSFIKRRISPEALRYPIV